MNKKPKILYVTAALNAPPHGGCMIRTTNICRQIKKYADLTMLAVSANFVPESVRACEKEFRPFYKVDIRHYSSYPDPAGRFLKKWHMHNPFTHGVQAAKQDQQRFQKLAAEHDIIWFHTLRAAHPFRFGRMPNAVMDLDDLRDDFYGQYAERASNTRFKWSARVQAYKWKKHQNEALENFDRVIVCSDEDKERLARPEKVRIIPNGYPTPARRPEWTDPDPDRIGFIGLLHYGPNQDGLIWFRDNVWPLIRKQHPKASLRIVGQLSKSQKHPEGQGFEYLGFLEDTTEEMKTWSALIVPITYGGGTRIKILDAFSKMTPVVSTVTGAYGIKAEKGKHLRVSDDPATLAADCLELMDEPEKGRAMAQAGWELFNETYAWDVIGVSLKNIIDELGFTNSIEQTNSP